MRIAYLGPAGTFTEDALREALGETEFEAIHAATVYEAIIAVERGDAERALVPFENSIEGSVRATLDTLAFDVEAVTIVGEYDYAVRPCLIAARELGLEEVDRGPLPPAAACPVRPLHPRAAPGCRASGRAAAPPRLSARWAGRASPGPRWARRRRRELYGCVVLREGVEDVAGNVTRFVWIAPAGTEPEGTGAWKTSLVFAELGEDHPGALVEALLEFSSREVNLTRIESRPLRQGLGRYMFFVDLEGRAGEPPVAGRDRRPAPKGRVGAGPRLLSGRLTQTAGTDTASL